MLIVTNGDAAVATLKDAGIPGHIFAWRDVLHEGPVPHGLTLREMSDVRAAFIADRGWGSEERVRRDFKLRDDKLDSAQHQTEFLLWFEHDLYDQLQLIQILDQLVTAPPEDTILSMICREAFVSHTAAELLDEWFEERESLDDRQLDLGSEAWDAFTNPSPEAWAALLDEDTIVLPFLADAIERLLEEYPAPGDGLSRSERQILEALTEGHTTPGSLFRATQGMEEAAFMGDASFWPILAGLTVPDTPLVAGEGPMELPGPRPDPGFLRQPLEITTMGRSVLAGEVDWMTLAPIDKWLGGVHLTKPQWRWDPEARQLLSS